MVSVAGHYRTHLAPVYLWMAGGFDAAVSRGQAKIEAIFPDLSSGITAVDPEMLSVAAHFAIGPVCPVRRSIGNRVPQ